MNKLSPAVKRFIVECLAMGETPTRAAKLVAREFPDVAVTPQQCEAYDPGKVTGRNLGPELREHYEAKRRDYERWFTRRANRSSRIMRLARMADQAEDRGAFKLAAELLEQIAKEEGDFYQRSKQDKLSPEEGRQKLAAMLGVPVERLPRRHLESFGWEKEG